MVASPWLSPSSSSFSMIVLALALVPSVVFGSFCGESSVPFSFEALPNGQPVLGCARPSCFGWTIEGQPAGKTASFYRKNKKSDGFMRRQSSDSVPKITSPADAPNFHAQTAKCASTFESEQCPSENQWIGGLGPFVNRSLPLVVRCCEYDALSLSEDRGVAVVAQGQIVVGGEVFHDGRQFAFDYISDIVKQTGENGSVSYDVSIRRLPCLPYPGEFSVTVDDSVFEDVIKRLTPKKKNGKHQKSDKKAYASATKDVSLPQYTQQGIEGPFPEDEVHEGATPVESGPANNSESLQPPVVQHGVSQYVPPPPPQTEYAAPPSYAGPPAAPAEPAQVPVVEYEWQWVPEGNYYPVAGGGGGSYFCFAKDSIVTLPSGATKRMDQLEVGDWVLSAGDHLVGYSRVRTWLHRMISTKAEFVRIQTEDGSTIKLTKQHYIYRGDCQSVGKQVTADFAMSDRVYAEEITTDNCLFVHDASTQSLVERRIAKIDHVVEEGIYAPLTENGNVIVDNVLASCFNVIENENLHESYSELVEWYIHSFWARIWGNDAEDVSLVPGLDTLIQMVRLVVPRK